MARTVDHISDSRLILGIGSGWFQRDYDEYGYPFGTAGSRLDALGEALPIITDRWKRLNPPPVRDIPVLVAGTGARKTLPLVARYATGWHAKFPSSPEEIAPSVARLVECCEAEGRDPMSIEWGLGLEPDMLDDGLGAAADRYREMGFRQFTLGVTGPDFDLSPVRKWLTWRDSMNG